MRLIPASRIFHHVTTRPTSVVEILTEHFKLTPERANELLSLGSIYSNKKRIFQNCPLARGVYLRLHLQPKRYPSAQINWKDRLVFETDNYVVINKLAGLPTHASVDNALENCLEQTRRSLGKPVFVTQRLDVPVGGLLVFAKNKKAQAKFNQWLLEKKIKKIYRAFVENPCPLGLVTHYMEPSSRAPKTLSSEPRANWLLCEMSILSSDEKKLENKTIYSLKIELHTGRTHQIRAQLAHLGLPILGDKLYGSPRIQVQGEKIALEAVQVGWPGQEEVLLRESGVNDSWLHQVLLS